MLDFPASGQALWDLFDATGIRPEYAIVCMMRESGLNPSARNPGSGTVGLNQLASPPAADYQSWSASRQIRYGVAPFWKWLLTINGPIESGTRLEQGNMYPMSLKSARFPWSTVIDGKKDPASYAGNAGTFDAKRRGKITVQGIADSLMSIADAPAVMDAIQQTYALRPAELPLDPVYGSDFIPEGGPLSSLYLIIDSVHEAGSNLIRRVRA